MTFVVKSAADIAPSDTILHRDRAREVVHISHGPAGIRFLHFSADPHDCWIVAPDTLVSVGVEQ